MSNLTRPLDPTKFAGSPALDEVIKGDGLGGWIIGPAPTGVGALDYQGTWDANANSPALASGVGVQGQYYVVSVDGTTVLDGIASWSVADWAIFNGTAWEKVPGGVTNTILLEHSTTLGVPLAGTRYLDRDGVACTSLPVLVTGAAVIRGLSIVVDSADATRNYIAEVITDPAGSPIVVASIALLATNVSNSRRDLAAVIPASTFWGVRVRKTAGVGRSSFNGARVEVELKIP